MKKMEKEKKRKKKNQKGEKKEKEKKKGRWKEDSLRNVGRTHGRTDTKVILYSLQCYALHWTDKNQVSIQYTTVANNLLLWIIPTN